MEVKNGGRILSRSEVLELIPQKPPFRFIDELLEISDNHAVGRYTFRTDEFFYAGHFPGNPITPGVIMLETMCQTGVVALGLFIFALEFPLDELKKYFTIFTEGEVEFYKMIKPGDSVIIEAQKVYWRRKKLKSNVQLKFPDGTLIASCAVAGIGVKNENT